MGKMGRPKSDNNKDFAYTVRMNKDTVKRLEAYCERMGILKPQAIREAIESYTETTEEDKEDGK